MTTQQKKEIEGPESDPAQQEADERDRKRRERIEQALLRWSTGPKKRPRFRR